jgi:hypothetical protein
LEDRWNGSKELYAEDNCLTKDTHNYDLEYRKAHINWCDFLCPECRQHFPPKRRWNHKSHKASSCLDIPRTLHCSSGQLTPWQWDLEKLIVIQTE